MIYLAQDRSQAQFAVKETDKGTLKKLVSFLKGCPRYINHCEHQRAIGNIMVWTDTDVAGCMMGRKKTSGGLLMHGSHII